MVSSHVYNLVHESTTVSSELATNPNAAPGDVVKRLYGHIKPTTEHHSTHFKRATASAEDLERAYQCGRWGPSRPSELFLQAFNDALNCLDADPMASLCSPPLMGSHGTLPLTVIAPLADTIRHISNLMVRAEREVFYLTCSWSPSVAQRLICDALVELSRRAGSRGQRVVVKIMYDKAGPKNFVNPHQKQTVEGYTGKAILLPRPEQIPNLDLEVISLHKPILGTLHAKFCVVDRKIGAIMSNNTEDNSNMEMLSHVEGPIVDSLYDTALITWNNELRPPLPSHASPASQGGLETHGTEPLYMDRGAAREQYQVAQDGEREQAYLKEHMPGDPHWDIDLSSEITRMQACYSTKPNESRLQAANRLLNLPCKNPIAPDGPDIPTGEEFTPYLTTMTPAPIPMAIVSRPPFGPTNHHNTYVPQNEAWLSLIRNAKRDIFIQSPDVNAAPLFPALVVAIKRGVRVDTWSCFGYNDAGEIIPGQGGTNDQFNSRLVKALTPAERQNLHICYYVGKDQSRPIHQSFGQRSCHIKLLLVDGHVAVQGSGNQDTQSWCHSQEINIMIDSEEVCRKWREGIERNQNTARFGRAAEDGVWRDQHGNEGEGSYGNPGQLKGLVKGVSGMLKKMSDKGGF